MAKRRNTFTRMGAMSHGATYACDTCGRRTRYTGAQSLGSKLCPQCCDLAGYENDVSDGNFTFEELRPKIAALFAAIRAKGGNPDASFAEFAAALAGPAA